MWASVWSDPDIRQGLLAGVAIIYLAAMCALALKLFVWLCQLLGLKSFFGI